VGDCRLDHTVGSNCLTISPSSHDRALPADGADGRRLAQVSGFSGTKASASVMPLSLQQTEPDDLGGKATNGRAADLLMSPGKMAVIEMAPALEARTLATRCLQHAARVKVEAVLDAGLPLNLLSAARPDNMIKTAHDRLRLARASTVNVPLS
jgi:hypothetical protein